MEDSQRKLNVESARVFREAIDRGISYSDVVKDPAGAASRAGVPLGRDGASRIAGLADPKYAASATAPSAQAIQALNAVILDGRFVDSWKEDIDAVFSKLSVPLDDAVRAELLSLDIDMLLEPDTVAADASVATTAAGVVAAVVTGAAVSTHHIARPKPVLDFSKLPKF